MILKIFDAIMGRFKKSNKGIFSKREIINILMLLRNEQMSVSCKEEQEKIWKAIRRKQNERK